MTPLESVLQGHLLTTAALAVKVAARQPFPEGTKAKDPIATLVVI